MARFTSLTVHAYEINILHHGKLTASTVALGIIATQVKHMLVSAIGPQRLDDYYVRSVSEFFFTWTLMSVMRYISSDTSGGKLVSARKTSINSSFAPVESHGFH